VRKTPFMLITKRSWVCVLAVALGCGDDSNPGEDGAPRILSTSPDVGESDVVLNGSVRATFSEDMDPATLTASTFTLTSGGVALPATVIYADKVVELWPAAHLSIGGSFTATISGAESAQGVPLAADKVWTFTTGDTFEPGKPVRLGKAGAFAILAKSGISTVPTSAISGDVGISPAAASFITGFGLTADATNVFSQSPQITGKVFAADYASPTPANMTTTIGDMELAFTDAAGRAPDVTELGAGNVGGMTLAPGVYKWGTGLLIPTSVTLTGGPTSVWIFQIAQSLTVSSGTEIILAGGALPENVFWQVSGLVELGTTAHLEGIVLSQTSIGLATGASINGRLLAQTAVTIDSSTVTAP
jgi:hypothetical protein